MVISTPHSLRLQWPLITSPPPPPPHFPPETPCKINLPPRNSIRAWTDNRWLDSFAAYNSKFNAKTEFDLSFKNLPTETSQFIFSYTNCLLMVKYLLKQCALFKLCKGWKELQNTSQLSVKKIPVHLVIVSS